MHLHGFIFSLIELAVEVRYTYLVDVHALKYVTSVSTSFHSYVCVQKKGIGRRQVFLFIFGPNVGASLAKTDVKSIECLFDSFDSTPQKRQKNRMKCERQKENTHSAQCFFLKVGTIASCKSSKEHVWRTLIMAASVPRFSLAGHCKVLTMNENTIKNRWETFASKRQRKISNFFP